MLVILDRDGTLNEMVVDAEHGTIDSPLHPSQVRLKQNVAPALHRLRKAGYHFAIATNQPAAAKGKTSRENLAAVHARVLQELSTNGIEIAHSFICYHRAEDHCACRKPQPGLLREALAAFPASAPSSSWMVGDGLTDLRAGFSAGVNVAFLAPKKSDIFAVLEENELRPNLWCRDLTEFAESLLSRSHA